MQPPRRLLLLLLLLLIASCVAVACARPSYSPGNPLIVEEPPAERYDACSSAMLANRNKPYSEAYARVLEECVPEIGVNGALRIIGSEGPFGAAKDFCHAQGHALGMLAVEITKNYSYLLEVEELRFCVLEALLIDLIADSGVDTPIDFTTLEWDIKQELRGLIEEFCLAGIDPGSCLHAFAHTMVTMAERTNSVADIEDAICAVLVDDAADVAEYWKMHNCLGGVIEQEQAMRFPHATCGGVRAQGECWIYRAQIPRRCAADSLYGQTLSCVAPQGQTDDCVRNGMIFGYASRHSDRARAGTKADHLLDCMHFFTERQDQIICVQGYVQHASYAWPSEAEDVCLGLFAEVQDQEMYDICVASRDAEIHGIDRDCSAIVCMDEYERAQSAAGA